VATNAKYWAALGDPTRRKIFELLVDQPSSVSGLANALPVTRPAVSQHLKVLKDAGLVADIKDYAAGSDDTIGADSPDPICVQVYWVPE